MILILELLSVVIVEQSYDDVGLVKSHSINYCCISQRTIMTKKKWFEYSLHGHAEIIEQELLNDKMLNGVLYFYSMCDDKLFKTVKYHNTS